MEMHPAKRVEIIIEAPLSGRLREAIEAVDITGYTVLPVLGGSGRSGRWNRDAQVIRSSGMVAVICVIRPERLEPLLEAAFAVVEEHIGVVNVTDCEVLRAERY